MRIRALIFVTVAVAVCCSAQDRPLGDVARETREQTSQRPKAAKVLTNEETNAQAVSASDDPIDVITKAAAAFLHDTSHRCRKTSSGNSGPGWGDVTVTEVAGSDRTRIILDQSRPEQTHGETILIGKDGYRRMGNGPWQKLGAAEMSLYGRWGQGTLTLPDQLKFGYKSGDLKLVGPQVIDGVPTLLYRVVIHSTEIERTINIWVGSNDTLPRRTEMSTHDPRIGTSWQETTSCSYGVDIKIEPPF